MAITVPIYQFHDHHHHHHYYCHYHYQRWVAAVTKTMEGKAWMEEETEERKIKDREQWLTIQVGDIVGAINNKRPHSVAEAAEVFLLFVAEVIFF